MPSPYKDLEEWPRGFKYSPQTGLIYRDAKNGLRWPACCIRQRNVNGYLSATVNRKGEYLQHRLAWLAMTGVMPMTGIDHINGNISDNRFCNLRLADNRENGNNKKRHRKGKKVGAIFDKRRNVWGSRIAFEEKHYHLGSFKTEEEAHLAYLVAKEEISSGQPPKNHHKNPQAAKEVTLIGCFQCGCVFLKDAKDIRGKLKRGATRFFCSINHFNQYKKDSLYTAP